MITLIELLQKASDFLEAKGVENARLNAELLFAEVFQCKRLNLYLMFERPVTEPEQAALRGHIVRRGKREPLQYILGHAEFHDLKLICDRRALIPRPETEELAARVIERMKESAPKRILDLGTGTGALALVLAQAFPDASVTAIDASAETLSLARENAAASKLDDRLRFLESDWFGALDGERFDLIVSNPPYLTESEWKCAQPEVRDFEPHGALVGGGEDGADDLRKILNEAPKFLEPGGCLALETGIAQSLTLEGTARLAGYMTFQTEKDDTGRPRYFFASLD